MRTLSTGEKIRLARAYNKMKQGCLAKKIGISQSALSLIENGKRRITHDLVVRISKITKVGIEFFSHDEAEAQ